MSAVLFWNHVLMEGVFCCSSCCVKVNATQIAASALPSCSEQRNNGGLSFSQGLISVFLQTEWLWLFMNEFKFVCLYSDLFRQRRRPVPKGLSLFCLYSLISLSGPSNGGPLPSLLVTWFRWLTEHLDSYQGKPQCCCWRWFRISKKETTVTKSVGQTNLTPCNFRMNAAVNAGSSWLCVA